MMAMLLMVCFTTTGIAQRVALRNNLPYSATLTPNLGIEYKLSPSWSAGINAGFNAWDIDDAKNRKWRHLMLSPNVRFYLPRRDSLSRSPFPSLQPAKSSQYVGLHAVYSHYNVGNVSFPLGLYSAVKDRRLQGDLLALGASYGYNWRLNDHWHLEAELGAALGYTWFKEYDCAHCGTFYGDKNKLFVLPKLALNIVYYLGSQQPEPAEPAPTPVEEPVTVFRPAVSEVPVNTGRAGMLQEENPVLEHISNYRPYDRTRILRKEKGALYVHFVVDESILKEDYRDNQPTLNRIIDITRQILADSTSTVKKIQIVGLASIEGPVAHNEQLAAQRAEALKQYIQQRVPTPDSLYDVANGGEAWAELFDQLSEQPQLASLSSKLRDIQSEPDPNRREQLLRQLDRGRAWQHIKTNVLSDQRNSGYLRIYFDYVPDTAAATINEASRLLAQQRYDEALRLLNSVRSDERAQNALGVALWQTGHKAEARDCFRRAAAAGNADAQMNLQQLELQ